MMLEVPGVGFGLFVGCFEVVLDGFEGVLCYVWDVFGWLLDGFGMICGAGLGWFWKGFGWF